MIIPLIDTAALIAYVMITLHILRMMHSGNTDDDETYQYCTTVIDPEMPMKYYDGAYIPLQYRGVLEQDSDGSYRYTPLSNVIDNATADETVQEVTK